MAIRGSKPGEHRGGRKKGVPNKTTKALKDMILGALNDAGGQNYLVAQARSEPKAFLALLGRVVPQELKASVESAVIVVNRSYGERKLSP